MAYQSIQALNVQCHRLPYLPPFPYLRHLVLCTDSLIEIFGSLEGFPYLETLSVTLFRKVEAPPRPDVELEHLPNLVHLHMNGFVPAVLKVGEACRVHTEWDDNKTSQIQWLLDWSGLGVELASFSFWSPDHLHEDALQHILDILHYCDKMELVRIVVPAFGTEREPMIVCPVLCQGLAKARSVVIDAGQCWLRLEDVQWQNLSLKVAGLLSLEIPDISALLQTISGFAMMLNDVRGTALIELVSACTSMGKYVTMDQVVEYGNTFSRVFTQMAPQKVESFTRTCACQACAFCLKCAGKVPRQASYW